MPYKIKVVPYDIHWPELFKNEANRIQKALGRCLKEIYHIGSTSISNMPAKPAIDMMLVLDNIDDDPIEYYVGYVDEKPVVRGFSCYFAQVAGLHWLSTVPSERRKGYGRAMQEYRLKRAKELGYHIAVLQASNEGYPLYRQLGYKECGHFREYKKLK